MAYTAMRQSRNKRMPAKNDDLHGNVPDSAEVALLLIDVINDLEFEGSQPLIEQVMAIAENIAALKRHARQAGIPVIYVNDNFGKWQSDRARSIGASCASVLIDSASSSPTCSATPKSASTKIYATSKPMSKGRTVALRRHNDCLHWLFWDE